MAAYLAEHVPHLQRLHVQLGLPPEALESDQNAIEAAIKNAVTALIRDREGEVDGWRDALEDVRRSMVSVGRALGDKGRDAVSAARRESENSGEALPLQHAKLLKQKEALEKDYDQRLAKIEIVRSQVEQLSILLGAPFEPPGPLQAIPGPSRPVAAVTKPLCRKRSSATLTTGPSGSRRMSTMPPAPPVSETGEGQPWYNVADDVLEELQTNSQRAIEEREARFQHLVDAFAALAFLHAELALPPVPLTQPHHFPIHLLPSRNNEERPGVYTGYEKALSRYITANPPSSTEAEEGASLKGLEGVEPEVALLAWAEDTSSLWNGELESRMAQIQALYDQLEPLWARLEVDQDQQDLFMEMNHGCGETVIRAYEAELERCLELRRSSLSSFVIAARKEIEMLWQELMLSEDEKGDFGAFINDDYTEELLQEHEDEAERLRAEIESKAAMLPKVRDWHALKDDEEELERTQNDPGRFSRRGGAMLREEKLRKRVLNLLPRVETELLNTLPTWEEINGRPFMVQGERVIDKIYDAREAKEAVKEAKKRAKQGLVPAKTVKATPGPASVRAPPSSTYSTLSRKREAPTPTPFGFGGFKKQKMAVPSTMKPAARTRVVSNPSYQTPREGASPTPRSGLPRAVSHTSSRTVSSSTAVSHASASTDRTRISSLTYTLKPDSGLSKADGRMPRRQSFKPRQSIAGGLIVAMKARRSSTGWSVREEDEEDVF